MQTRDDETRGGRGCRTESNDFSPALLETRLRFVSKGNFVSREEEVDRHVRWTRNESGRQIPNRRASLLPLFTHESYVSSIATFDSLSIGIIGIALDQSPPAPRGGGGGILSSSSSVSREEIETPVQRLFGTPRTNRPTVSIRLPVNACRLSSSFDYSISRRYLIKDIRTG